MSRSTPLPLLLTLLATAGCIVIDGDDCRYRDSREAAVPVATGLDRVEVRATTGSLRVVGRAGATAVHASGTACARRRRDLERVELSAWEEEGRVVIEATVPRTALWASARLDLVVEVPAEARVEVDDSTGDVTVDGVAALDIDDASGDLVIRHVAGAVTVDDDSGDVEIDGAGRVRIEDGSGDVDIRHAAAVTVVDDGSGDLAISDIAGDVLVENDGSGDIEVSRIGGNLTVENGGSGNVDYREVAGTVEVANERRSDRDRG